MKSLPVIIVGSGDGHDDVHGINILCSRRLILFLEIFAEEALARSTQKQMVFEPERRRSVRVTITSSKAFVIETKMHSWRFKC